MSMVRETCLSALAAQGCARADAPVMVEPRPFKRPEGPPIASYYIGDRLAHRYADGIVMWDKPRPARVISRKRG